MKLTYISKETSILLRGVALFLMVFLHLFNQMQNVQGLFCLFKINDVPVVNFLSKGCNPVGYYLFISGYGLCFSNKGSSLRNKIFKIVNLFILYWVTLVIFVLIGHYIKPDVYPGDVVTIIKNLSSFRTTYNGEAWFIFPYVLLALSSGVIFAFCDRFGGKKCFAFSCSLYFIAIFLISRYYKAFFDNNYWAYHVVLYFDCLFPFVLGALFCRYSKVEAKGFLKRIICLPNLVKIVMLLMVFLSGCIVSSAAWTPFCQCAIIFLFIHIDWNVALKRGLNVLGHYSTVVWLLHTWFCYYLFKDFIYGFHYPLIIIFVLFGICIPAGFVVQKIADAICICLHLKIKKSE